MAILIVFFSFLINNSFFSMLEKKEVSNLHQVNEFKAKADVSRDSEIKDEQQLKIVKENNVLDIAKIEPKAAQENTIYVSQFGVRGDGKTDDAPAIRKAIQYARDNKISKIVFDAKTYLLSSTVNGIYLPLYSNLTFIGKGEKTVLLQAGGKLENGDPKIFFSEDYVENIGFSNLTIDLNGTANLCPQVIKRANIAIGAKRARNVNISKIIFKNNAGRQTIMLGSSLKNKGVFDVVVSNCKFINVGNGVKGNNIQTDHSCIYVVAERFTCNNNTFYNPPISNQLPVSTAIESHSDFARVEGNTISNFKNAFNIVATVSSHVNSSYRNNTCNNVMRLAEFWVWNNNTMDNIIIENNKLTQIIPTEAFSLTKQVKTPINNLVISQNYIEYVGSRSSKYSFPSIISASIKNLTIENNVFKNLPSGVLLSTSKVGETPKITITGNKVIDCGNTNANNSITYHTAFLLNGTDGGELLIDGNTIQNSSDKGFIERGVILDNNWRRKNLGSNVYDKVSSKILDNRK